MAKLTAFMMFENIQNSTSPEGINVAALLNPIVVVRPAFIPSYYSFVIAIGLQEMDVEKNNTLRIKITKPSSQEECVFDSGLIFLPVIHNAEENLPKKYQGFSLNVDLRNISFTEEGEYTILIIVNDEKIDKRSIPVFRQGR